MKNSILFFAFSVLSFAVKAASGGPDTYGYTWTDSNEPGGPAYSWVDISTTGTLITGLTDDNSVGMIPMGMNFHYYWGDFNALKIGSNGWLGFDNIGNIASCFPSIPTAGGAGDNFLAPLLSDLILGAGYPGSAYYLHDVVNNRFIVSFVSVAHWQAAAPGYFGSSTFQVILSNADSSITFQYLNSNFGGGACPLPTVNQVIGIEGPTGTIGLTHSINLATPNNYAIKFKYPPVVLVQIQDLTPFWTLTPGNKAKFFYTNAAVSIPVNVKNTGNANVTTSYTVNVIVKSPAGAIVSNTTQTITGGLQAGDDTLLQFTFTPTVLGQYSIESLVTNTNDINPGNNLKIVELQVLQQTNINTRLSNVNQANVPTGQWSLTGGVNDGGGLHIIPPSYPFIISGLKAYLTVTAGVNDVKLRLLNDDGVNGSPGTIRSTTTVTGVTATGWTTANLTTPDTLYSGGVYVAWLQDTLFPGVVLGTYNLPPLSRRNFELVAGGWAEWRSNELEEMMLEIVGRSVCAGFAVVPTNLTQVTCNGQQTGSITVAPNGSPSSGPFTYTWTNFSGTTATAAGLGTGLYSVTVTNAFGCQATGNYSINQPPAIVPQTTSTDVLCFGGVSGTANVIPTGGTPPLTLNWGGLNPSLLSAGNKIFTITDANGCVLTDTVVIGQPALLVLTSTQVNENLGNDGSIDLTVTGGTAPYTYSWTNGAGIAQDPMNLSAGTYSVTVTDANNCVSNLTINILNVLSLNENALDAQVTIVPNPSKGIFEITTGTFVNVHIEIKDITGKIVFQQKMVNESGIVNLTGESPGVYFIDLRTNNLAITRKIVLD